MVANIMKNERRWGDLEARKSIVVDYKLGKVTKNNGNRCSAYVPEHHEAIVSPEIARAAHLVASSRKKCGVQDIVVIQQGTLKGFVGIHPNWSGISVESIRCLCLSTYLPEEVAKLNDIAEMRTGTTLGNARKINRTVFASSGSITNCPSLVCRYPIKSAIGYCPVIMR